MHASPRAVDQRVAPGPLTILVDGDCPFCRLERRWLEALAARRAARADGPDGLERLERLDGTERPDGTERLDGTPCLRFEDIADPGFDASVYGLQRDATHGTLHAVTADGTILRGMQVFRAAYAAVGLGWLLAPTGWPLLRPIADLGYRLFARYRVRLGRIFGRGCEDGSCGI